MQNQPHQQIAFEDLSGGTSGEVFANPYDVIIKGSGDDIKEIQGRYATHRVTRNAQQKAKLLDPSFSGILIDPILSRLEDPSIEPGYQDPRHCLVLWGRPPKRIRELISQVQEKIKAAAPNIWLMPIDNLHITAMEVTHSKTAPEIDELVVKHRPALTALASYTKTHSPRLLNPMIGYDAQALAISFLPAAGEDPLPDGRTAETDNYSYHHLRRDLHDSLSKTGLEVGSRYVVPSAHLTIARFTNLSDFEDDSGKVSREKMMSFVDNLEQINEWLQKEHWTKEKDAPGAQWIVGEEKGLDCREGQLWYGGGTSIAVGESI